MVSLTAEAMYFCIVIAIILFCVSVYMKDAALGAISALVMGLTGIYLIQNGFQGQSDFLIQSIGLILSILGGYVFLRILFEQMVDEVNMFGGS